MQQPILQSELASPRHQLGSHWSQLFHGRVAENQKTIESREFSHRDMRQQFSEASLPQKHNVPCSYPLYG